jgi:hypothetical protein
MKYYDMDNAIQQASEAISISDCYVNKMAQIIAGRLRHGGVSCGVLEQLKKELKDYNIHTSCWKD